MARRTGNVHCHTLINVAAMFNFNANDETRVLSEQMSPIFFPCVKPKLNLVFCHLLSQTGKRVQWFDLVTMYTNVGRNMNTEACIQVTLPH